MESAWSRYKAYLKNSTPALLHLDPHAYMRALTGFTQVRLVSYTHGRHDRSSVRSYVWFKLLMAYSISPWIKQSVVVQFILTKLMLCFQKILTMWLCKVALWVSITLNAPFARPTFEVVLITSTQEPTHIVSSLV